MKQVTIKYGISNITRSVPDSSKVGDVVGDSSVKAVLGYGDNVRVLVNGVQMPSDAIIEDGSVLVVETACNQKAS